MVTPNDSKLLAKFAKSFRNTSLAAKRSETKITPWREPSRIVSRRKPRSSCSSTLTLRSADVIESPSEEPHRSVVARREFLIVRRILLADLCAAVLLSAPEILYADLSRIVVSPHNPPPYPVIKPSPIFPLSVSCCVYVGSRQHLNHPTIHPSSRSPSIRLTNEETTRGSTVGRLHILHLRITLTRNSPRELYYLFGMCVSFCMWSRVWVLWFICLGIRQTPAGIERIAIGWWSVSLVAFRGAPQWVCPRRVLSVHRRNTETGNYIWWFRIAERIALELGVERATRNAEEPWTAQRIMCDMGEMKCWYINIYFIYQFKPNTISGVLCIWWMRVGVKWTQLWILCCAIGVDSTESAK